MNNWFTWKGHNCTEFGIHVTQLPEIIRPPERATFTLVPGRSGTLPTLEGAMYMMISVFIQDDYLIIM